MRDVVMSRLKHPMYRSVPRLGLVLQIVLHRIDQRTNTTWKGLRTHGELHCINSRAEHTLHRTLCIRHSTKLSVPIRFGYAQLIHHVASTALGHNHKQRVIRIGFGAKNALILIDAVDGNTSIIISGEGAAAYKIGKECISSIDSLRTGTPPRRRHHVAIRSLQ